MTPSTSELSTALAKRLHSVTPVSVKRSIKRVVPSKYHRHLRPEWHRRKVGGYWEEMGQLQFDFLVAQGLEPNHQFLDVGCGSLRGGVHFIRYLEPGHYIGVDANPDIIRAGREIELPKAGLTDRRPQLVEMANFDFASLERTFDFALAQSVFTHLPLNSIIRCLMSIEPVLAPDGKFFATFFENPQGKQNLESLHQPRGDVITHFDRDLYHYDFATFEWICEGTSLLPEYIGEWEHPRSQRMLVFTREAERAAN